MISRIVGFFVALASFVVAMFGIKFYKEKLERAEENLKIVQKNKDVLSKANQFAESIGYDKIVEIKDEIQDDIDSSNFGNSFNPVLPDDKTDRD